MLFIYLIIYKIHLNAPRVVKVHHEEHIDLIRNRNQHCFLSRLHTNSHNLRVELGRDTKPMTPFAEPVNTACGPADSTFTFTSLVARRSAPPDTEFHFLMESPLFSAKRSSFLTRCQLENNQTLSAAEKFKVLFCTTNAICVKLVHIFVKNMTNSDDGQILARVYQYLENNIFLTKLCHKKQIQV